MQQVTRRSIGRVNRLGQSVKIAAAVMGACASYQAALGASFTWVGPTTDNNFSTAANWNTVGGHAVPGATDDAIFTAAAATVKTTNVDSAVTLDSLAFQQGAASWTVSGSDITLKPTVAGALTLIVPKVAGSSLSAITSNIILNGNQLWATIGAANAAPNLSFGGAISLGANTLTLFHSTGTTNTINATFAGSFSGTGQLVREPSTGTCALLGSSPNWSGGMTIYGGTLVAGTDLSLGTGTVTLSPSQLLPTSAPASTSFQSATNRTFANNFVLNNLSATQGNWVITNLGATTSNPAITDTFNGTVTLVGGGTPRVMTAQNANAAVFNQPIGESGGSAPLQLATPGSASGTGTYTFNATNTYTGGTTMWAGTLNLNAPQSGDFVQGTGTTSTLNLNATMTSGNYTSSAGTITLNSPQSSTTFTIKGAVFLGKSASTFPGGVTATSGNISFATDSVGTVGNIVSGPIGTGALTVAMTLATNTLNISNGSPGVSGTARTILNNISIGGTGNIQFGNTNVPEFFNIQSTPTVTANTVNIGIKNGSITTFAGGLAAANGISLGVVNDGSFATGAFILPTANSIRGDAGGSRVTLNNGIVVLGNDQSLGDGSFPIFMNGTAAAFPIIAAPTGQTRVLNNTLFLNGTAQGFGGRGIVGTGTTGTYFGTITLNGPVNLNNATTTAITLLVDAAGTIQTVANLTGPITEFNGPQGIIKTGGGTLNVTNSGNFWSNGTTVAAGTLGIHTDSMPTDVVLATGGTLQFNQDADGSFPHVISGVGNISKIGAGKVTLPTNNTITGSVAIDAGTLEVTGHLNSSKLTGAGPGILSVPGGTLTVSAHTAGVANDNAATLASLSITSGGKVDLANNDLIITYSGLSSAATIAGYLQSGYNGGTWDGAGIASSTAHATPATALGIADAADVGLISVDGNPVTSAVVVKYTYYGDSSLDGKVDLGNDFNLFIQGYLSGATSWELGNYNYDSTVDTNDFQLFVDGYTASQGAGALGALDNVIESSALLSASQKAQLLSVVPEPASASILLAGATMLIRRRRRA